MTPPTTRYTLPHPVVLIDNADDGYVESRAWIEATGAITRETAAAQLVAQLEDAAEGVRPTGVVTGPVSLVPLLWSEDAARWSVVLPGTPLTLGDEESIQWRRLSEYPAAAYSLPFWIVEFEEVA